MEWFKFYGGAYLSDPKMLMLTACERSCWVTLLSFASVAEDGGRIKYLTEPQLMTAANVSPMHEEWDLTVGVLDKFEKLGMITQSNDEVTILNWNKRQESYLTNAQRQARYREKQKSNMKVTEELDESNARIEENRIDKKDISAEEPREEIELPEREEKPKRQSTAKYPHSKEVFTTLFSSSYDPEWNRQTTYLQKAEWIYGKVTVEDSLQDFQDWRVKHSKCKWFPQADTPHEMFLKWEKFERHLNECEV